MSKNWPKIICDPVHKLITFEDTPCDHLLLNLINTREFQRLRRIKQLGMSDLVYPGANHTRFSHSIGVMHIARRFLERIERLHGRSFDENQRVTLLVAALLHDIGHGPFSHAFETITGDHHEKRTVEILIDHSTEVNHLLREYDPSLPEQLVRFFAEDYETAPGGFQMPRYFTQIISSQLDADRSDYLLRDSYATGTDYGLFNLEWMINHLYLDLQKDRFYLSAKALSVAEAYVFARYHMYRCVYFHKTTRAAEVMLQLAFQRYKYLINHAGPGKIAKIAPNAPLSIVSAFSEPMDLAQYLLLDDFTVMEFLKSCEYSEDQTLNFLGKGIIRRQLFKAIEATVGELDFPAPVRQKVKELGYDPDYMLIVDTTADTPYKPYDPESTQPSSQIYIEDLNGKIVEISSLSNTIEQLKKKYTLIRYYCPGEIRDQFSVISNQ